MARPAVLLLLAAAAGAEMDADAYFDAGVGYLKKGLFRAARSAFAESLVRAPGQPVPMAFLAVAGAAEGRPVAESALLLRWAHARMPAGRRLRLDFSELLPSRTTLDLLEDDLRRLAGRREERRLDALAVLAFLEVHDGDPAQAPALDALLRDLPADPYGLALAALRAPSGPEVPRP